MKPVYQKVFGSPGKGDCLPAAIASILEIDLEEVPRTTFVGDESLTAFLKERSLAIEIHWYDEVKPEIFDGAPEYFIAVVLSQARLIGEGFNHAVVGRWVNGCVQIAHNPNPNAAPYPPNQAIGILFLRPV